MKTTQEIGQLPFPAGEIERIARGLRQKPKGERAASADEPSQRAFVPCPEPECADGVIRPCSRCGGAGVVPPELARGPNPPPAWALRPEARRAMSRNLVD